ncbi:serine/threonine-protein phosphatase Pgam5, mitochondrial [Drosophila miranda]|uniref:serine/threonine-protein phosphatase Pgam5, mitochondrial n=1 Tax=Drosophila miranda TaxID=7229 RepID=UPI0007E82B7A|nr:serine/threonine-protein phosphatase Pgam5, mitochondrial [Drosophila miranda]
MHTLRFRSLVTSTSAWLISHHRSTCEGDGIGIGDSIQPSWVTDWDQDHPHAAQVSQGQKSKSSRHIILVRHGQYEKAPNSPDHLTDLGREQAKWTGKRLREFNITWDQVVVSTMTRAQQTSAIILKELDVDPCKVVTSDELREGAPYFADPPTKRSPRKQEEAVRRDAPRIEAAFKHYFYRAPPDQERDTYLLIICHANVIRYVILRALQLPPQAWTRLSLNHGSITWLTVRPSGYVSLRCMGDSGFMPVKETSTSNLGSVKSSPCG